MTASRMTAPQKLFHSGASGFRAFAATGQYILNLIGEAARRAADQSRFAALPRRYLDDAGMTFADLDAALSGLNAIDPRNSAVVIAHAI